jgi:hypothetical protein
MMTRTTNRTAGTVTGTTVARPVGTPRPVQGVIHFSVTS